MAESAMKADFSARIREAQALEAFLVNADDVLSTQDDFWCKAVIFAEANNLRRCLECFKDMDLEAQQILQRCREFCDLGGSREVFHKWVKAQRKEMHEVQNT